jgi:predicted nucleotidyltransferase
MGMKTLSSHILAQKDFFEALGEKYHFRMIVLFGSVARGVERVTSDIDIAVLSARGEQMSWEESSSLSQKITHVLGSALNVDVRSLDSVSPIFLSAVMSDAVVLYEDVSGRCAQYKLYAQKQMMETYAFRMRRWEHTVKTIQSYA